MKRILATLSLAIVLPAFAQTYSIDWFKIAGAGATSSNGAFAVSGTMGQSDAGGSLSGGDYSVTSGFWSLFAVVQPSGAPRLSMLLSGGYAVLSWPVSSAGFVLQQSGQVATTNWVDVAAPLVTNAANVQVSLPINPGNHFFRLNKRN